MAERLTLIKQVHPEHAFHYYEEREIPYERVVGITVGSSTLEEYESDLTDDTLVVREEELRLSRKYADKMVEFYERCRVASPDMRPGYDCHRLVSFMMGRKALTASTDDCDYICRSTPVANRSALVEGRPYCVIRDDGKITHSMIGAADPRYNVAVLGIDQPMYVVGNQHTAREYNGEIHRTEAPSGLISSILF